VGPLPLVEKGAPTFGCFNNPAKLSDACLELWARVMQAVPEARIVFKFHGHYGSASLRSRVEDALQSRGVAGDRLQFLEADPPGLKHLDIYNLVDLALDSFPFTGSTTTFESLWMGVPVVTLVGDTMVSRWSASILRSIGLPELVAPTAERYIELAAGLVREPARLAALRATLRQRITASPLCDGAARTRQLERVYRALWRRWRARQAA